MTDIKVEKNPTEKRLKELGVRKHYYFGII